MTTRPRYCLDSTAACFLFDDDIGIAQRCQVDSGRWKVPPASSGQAQFYERRILLPSPRPNCSASSPAPSLS